MQEEKSNPHLDYKKHLKIQLSNTKLRKWLKIHGKEKFIDFDLHERKKYREIFEALDYDDSGAIGIDELEEPFIALGLVSN